MQVANPLAGLSSFPKEYQAKTKNESTKEIHVVGIGQTAVLPDLCRIRICVSSIKDDVSTAKNSVVRRLDYILQSAHNHHIKDSSVKVSKILTRVKEQYRYTASVFITSSELNDIEDLCNLLTEKLDSSVIIGDSRLSHSQDHLERARRNASDLALKNARAKAADMARQFSMTLGAPILIHEDATQEISSAKEEENNNDDALVLNDSNNIYCWCGDLDSKTVTMRAKVSVTFELRKSSKFDKI